MKKLISILMLLMAFTMSSNAMSYEQARQQALFLTDKMAYELNLTNDQYEAAYEINLDYLMSVNTVDDLYGAYWRYRNLDMSYVLLDWQYRAFCDAAYFYRPLYFNAGYWHFGIYARYPHRDYFYFNRPTVYVSYCGGHSWGMNRGRSWYHGRDYGPRRGDNHFGMRDGFDRGDYGRGMQMADRNNTRQFGNGNRTQVQQSGNHRTFGNGQRYNGAPQRTFGGSSRQSSTRTTVTQPYNGQRTFGRSNTTTVPNRTFSPSNGASRSFGNSNRQAAPSNSFRSSGIKQSTPTRSFTAPSKSSSPSRSFGGGNNNGGSRSTGGHFGRR